MAPQQRVVDLELPRNKSTPDRCLRPTLRAWHRTATRLSWPQRTQGGEEQRAGGLSSDSSQLMEAPTRIHIFSANSWTSLHLRFHVRDVDAAVSAAVHVAQRTVQAAWGGGVLHAPPSLLPMTQRSPRKLTFHSTRGTSGEIHAEEPLVTEMRGCRAGVWGPPAVPALA